MRFAEFPYKQITSNEIERFGFPWTMLDNIPSNFVNKPLFILNLDHSDGSGTHWTLVCPNTQTKILYYFDPLGHANDGEYPNILNPEYEKKTGIPYELDQWADKHGFRAVKTNNKRFQHINSWMCGFIVIYLASNINPATATSSYQTWNNTLHRILGNGPSPELVNRVVNWFNQKSQ